ncbi:hypothetical protein [Paraburkholderia saeva]|uniref:Uncharacterized protein n=1 Tax=Paraburkholderia saeva TaxID=2777537 RepID=A0A9N8X0S2_9BURK|nr:hypothetical protein [Paraburkholderia saeva]CAG4886928.1 hypothetical protein LMG31841_00294 [Paraburkholderia saeva]
MVLRQQYGGLLTMAGLSNPTAASRICEFTLPGRSEANANVNVSAYLPEGSAQWKQWLASKRHLFGTGWLDDSVLMRLAF